MVYTTPRSAWNARYPDGFGYRPLPISEFWLHHSVTIAPDLVAPFTDDDAAVRTLENIGQQRFGGGISYTYPVTPVGRLYQGHSLDRRGAHTKGHNTVAAAFCLVGDYTRVAPTLAQKTAIAEKMVELHREGKATRHTLNGGHRNVFGTSCPGDAGYAAIPEINRLAEQIWQGKVPPTSSSSGDTVTLWRHKLLATHGVWSNATKRRLQAEIGVTPDGVIGPASRKALQRWAGVTPDGVWGPATYKAWQKKVGVKTLTGRWTSYLVLATQRYLNSTRLKKK